MTSPDPAAQLTADDLKGMSPAAIVKAQSEGLCHNLLTGVRPDQDAPVVSRDDAMPKARHQLQLTSADLIGLTPAEIVNYQKAGLLADLLDPRRTA